MIPVTPIFEDATLRVETVERAEATGNRVLLCFTGIGRKLGGIDVQGPEFLRAGAEYRRAIFVTDLQRRWGNGLDFGWFQDLIAPYLSGAARVDAIGNSMGGFLALLVPRFLTIGTSIAFVPQYSVHPDMVPFERRWDQYRNNIRDWTVPSLEGQFVDKTNYYLFSGGNRLDLRHLRMMPQAPNITRFVVRDSDHNVALRLKEAGLLTPLIERCLDGRFTRRWLAGELGYRSTHTVFDAALFGRLRRAYARVFN